MTADRLSTSCEPVVYRPLDLAEGRQVGLAVHLRVTVFINRATAPGHDRMTQAPARLIRLAGLPGRDCDFGQSVNQEFQIFDWQRDPVVGQLVGPFLDLGGGVGTGVQEQLLLGAGIGNLLLGPVANRAGDTLADRHQVTRDHDRMVEHLASIT